MADCPRSVAAPHGSIDFYVETYIVCGMNILSFESTLSVTDASKRGLSRIVADAESGAGVVVERRGKPAAVVVGMKRMQSILEREDDLRSAALILSRAATDTGNRTSLDEVISAFGFDRAELEGELEADQAAGFAGASPVSPT
jgi:antitoxin (DNA-binding transcriptional repressor) of toxin-antitoxin stability system